MYRHTFMRIIQYVVILRAQNVQVDRTLHGCITCIAKTLIRNEIILNNSLYINYHHCMVVINAYLYMYIYLCLLRPFSPLSVLHCVCCSTQVHVTLTPDQNKIFKALQPMEPNGSVNFVTGIRIAHVSIQLTTCNFCTVYVCCVCCAGYETSTIYTL